MVKDDMSIFVCYNYQLQRGNADLSNVKEVAVMHGVVTDITALKAGEAKVTLKNICYVIKLSAKVPSDAGIIKSVTLQATKTDGSDARFGYRGAAFVNDPYVEGHGNIYLHPELNLGNDFDNASGMGTGISPDDSGHITAYLVAYTGMAQTLPAGATLEVKLRTQSTELNKSSTPLARGLTLKPGKMYRINVDMTE